MAAVVFHDDFADQDELSCTWNFKSRHGHFCAFNALVDRSVAKHLLQLAEFRTFPRGLPVLPGEMLRHSFKMNDLPVKIWSYPFYNCFR